MSFTVKNPLQDLDLSQPQIMGILNATPDSFSDGGRYLDVHRALDRIHIMRTEGASIIDIGGESTRPGADSISVKEEVKRVLPIIQASVDTFPDTILSIDTTKYEVAEVALRAGVRIINDVSGIQKDPQMAELAGKYGASYVIMHSVGDPKNMQDNPSYTNVVEEVYAFFEKQIKVAQSYGVETIILDPGIGFGKTTEHNLKLLAHLDKFKKIGFPILVGASRKSMIGNLLDERPVEDRLIGTIAVHYDALTRGANILRVHDVKEASDSLRIFQAIQSQR
ncbi:dihydropteroate synthase [Balneola vulgaris]|uniref:dihydropteroate synthase n=1 Tax=Balneola vulgaris TaxID=287535 RepID=UPI0003738D2E|nr:dihydropteroate synthase [Balneola vulgaris]